MLKKLAFAVALVVLTAVVLFAVQKALGLDGGAVQPDFVRLSCAVGTYFLTLAFMGLRLWVAMGGTGSVRFLPLLDMTLLHNFLMVFLPARLGDGYYPFLIAARTGRKLGAGVGNLVLLRLLDVACITTNLCLVLPWVVADGVDPGVLPFMLAGLMTVLLLVIVNLTRVLEWAARIVRRGVGLHRLVNKLFRLIVQARNWNRAISARDRLILFAISLFAWAANVVTYYLILTGLGLDLGFPRSVFAGQLAEIGGVLPLQTVAGIGASEGLLAGVLTAYGNPFALAAVLAVWARLSILGGAFAIFVIRAMVLFAYRLRVEKGSAGRTSMTAAVFAPGGVFAADPREEQREAR